MMRPTCISLQVSDTSSQEILKLCEGLPIQFPPDFNCFFHTSILQFYTELDLVCVKNILKEIEHTRSFANVLSNIFQWDNKFKMVNNASLSLYDNISYALMINYDVNRILLEFAQNLFFLLQEFVVATGINDTKISNFNYRSLAKESRFQHVYDFPRKIQSSILRPDTTVGFVKKSDLTFVNDAVNSLFCSRKQNYYHTKIVLSELTHLCMTPLSNSIEVWRIQ